MHAVLQAHAKRKKDNDNSLYSDISWLERARSGSRLPSAIHLQAQDIVDLSAEELDGQLQKTWKHVNLMLTLREANAQPGHVDFVGHYTPLEKAALKDQEDLIHKLKRKVRKWQQRVPGDAVDASDATSETPTEEEEEEKARRKAKTRKKRRLRKEKAEAEKENQAQLLLKLAHYRQAEV